MRIAMGTLFLGLMLFFLALNPRTDADQDRKGRIEGKAATEERVQKRKDEAAKAEWFPDPERGWIRLQEGDRKENAGARNRDDNPRLKNEQDRTRWEY